MFVDDRWLVVRELHRQPLADLRQPPFFRVVFDGRQMVVDDRRAVLVGQRFSMQHQQPSTTKQGCHTKWIYTFDPEKCRWWRNRGRVVLSWSATGRRLVVGADLHNQLYHPHFKRNSNMYSWNCPRMVVKCRNFFWRQGDSKDYANHVTPNSRRPIGDYSPNGCWSSSKMWSMFDNQSASNWQLVVDHSATGRQTVGDRSANSRRPIED